MSNQMITYALVKTFYDETRDLVEPFIPFVLQCLSQDDHVHLDDLCDRLGQSFDMKMPLHVARRILDAAVKKRLVSVAGESRNEHTFMLTKSGASSLRRLESERDVKRRVNALAADLASFLTDRGVSATSLRAREHLLSAVRAYMFDVVRFLDPDQDVGTRPDVSDPIQNLVFEYIGFAEEEKPDHYRTIQDIVYGSILSSVLYSDSPEQLNEISSEFKGRLVYLDSNYLFSLLGYHPALRRRAADELFELLKSCGFDIRVFPFTVVEMQRYVLAYRPEKAYPLSDTVFAELKRRGTRRSDLRRIADSIQGDIASMGVRIDGDFDLDLRTAQGELRERRASSLQEYKLKTNPLAALHDVVAIEQIRRIRGHAFRKLAEAKAYFLTSDGQLSRFNLEVMGHREDGTVPEVILDRVLAGILWLKNPAIDVQIETMIAAHSNSLLVDRAVWNRFSEVLSQLDSEGEGWGERLTMLHFDSYIETALAEIDEDELDDILTPEFVRQKIVEAEALFENKLVEATTAISEADAGPDALGAEQIRDLIRPLVEEQVSDSVAKQVAAVREGGRESARASLESEARNVAFFIAAGAAALVDVTAVIIVAVLESVFTKAGWTGYYQWLTSFTFGGTGLIVLSGAVFASVRLLALGRRRKQIDKLLDKMFEDA